MRGRETRPRYRANERRKRYIPFPCFPESLKAGTAPTNNDNMTNFHELIEGFRNFREDYLLREAEF